MPDRYGFVIFR